MPPQAGDTFLNRCSLASSIKKTGKKTRNYSQPKPKESTCQTPWRDRLLRSRNKTSKLETTVTSHCKTQGPQESRRNTQEATHSFRRRSCSVVLTRQIIKSVRA